MKNIIIMLLACLFLIILVYMLFNTPSERYEINIYTEESASTDFKKQVNELIENSELKYVVVNWSTRPADYIKEFPFFVVRTHQKSNVHTFRTSDLKEFEDHLEMLKSLQQ